MAWLVSGAALSRRLRLRIRVRSRRSRVVWIGKADVLAALLQHVEDTALVGRLQVRLQRLDLLGIDELDQRVVHRYHAKPPRRLKNRRELEGLPFANQVRDRRRRQHDLASGNAATADLLAENLRDDALQRFREHDADLRLPIGRKLVDDAIDGAYRARRVHRSKNQVTGLRCLDRHRDSLEIAQLTNEHNVRIFAQRRAQRVLERRRVHADVPLRYQALLALVYELNRILDRDDVIRASPVDQIDQCTESS